MRVKRNKGIKEIHRDVAVLLDKDTILLEDGTEMPYDCVFDNTKIFAPSSLAKDLWTKIKIGEIQSFDNRIIKWRKKCPDHYKVRTSWPGNSLEVSFFNSRSYPENPSVAVEQFANWRDWVEENGGNIKGTLSNTSASLFRATLPKEGYETPFEKIKGIDSPLGGRLLPCKSLYTTFSGDYIQWDLYSAYSKQLSRLRFGGIGSRWIQTKNSHNFDNLVDKGYLIYIEATVKIPDIKLGPIPIRRDRKFPNPMWDWLNFPTNDTIKGIWSYEEIRQADAIGCKIKISRIFYHEATGRKYWHEDWYNIIESGKKNLQGFAKSLAKQTGNSLWGRYAMRPRPSRTKWRDENGKRHSEVRNIRISKGNQCMELADQLCGKIRASLFELAISAGNNLIQGNTDGAWLKYDGRWNPPNHDWRVKHRATRIDVIDDRTYRYWEPGEKDPEYIAPGIDLDFSVRIFNKIWNEKERQIIEDSTTY